MSLARTYLDDPVFASRLRVTRRTTYQPRPPVRVEPRTITDIKSSIVEAVPIKPGPIEIIEVKEQTIAPAPQVLPKPKTRWQLSPQVIMYAMATVLFLGGMATIIKSWQTNRSLTSQAVLAANSEQDNYGGTGLVESDISTDERLAYQVAPKLPRYIQIPSVGVDARVLGLGLNKDHSVAVPTNIFDTGWYNGSKMPGEPGATLIVGHVSGPTKPGVFSELKRLKPDDNITIEKGDGTKVNYRVKSLATIPREKVDMAELMKSAVPGTHGLSLITCAGKFDSNANTFKERLVVFAVQV